MAFQLIDDALDYEGSTEQLGKNVGDDLAEGKVTLPIIAAMRNCTESETQLLRSAIQNGGLENLGEVMEIVTRTGGLDYTNEKAELEIQKALTSLENIPESTYKDAMISLASFSISRNT